MEPVKRILCVIDPTADEQPAMERAVMLARAFEAEVRLYISCHYEYLTDIAAEFGPVGADLRDICVHNAQNRLEMMADKLRSQGFKVSAVAEWHRRLAESIVEQAASFRADLVVKETHYHSAIKRALFTNTDWDLIRRCPGPLWLVKKSVSFDAPPVLVASVDPVHEHDKPASLDDDIIAAGLLLADRLGGDLKVFHAYNPLAGIAEAATWSLGPLKLDVDEVTARVRDMRQAACRELSARHDIPGSHCIMRDGTALATLPATAIELDAQLVILGAVSRRRIRDAMIGSTAESVMDHLPCDLLVIPALNARSAQTTR